MSDMNRNPAQKHPLLEMRAITKTFPGVRALNQVSLKLGAGEVLALLGENGAGKSTLIKVLGGAYPADSGEIRIHGEITQLSSPAEASAKRYLHYLPGIQFNSWIDRAGEHISWKGKDEKRTD